MSDPDSPRNFSVTVVLATAIGSLMAVMLIIVQLIHFTANEKNTAELLIDKARNIVVDIEQGVRLQLDQTAEITALLAAEMVDDQGLVSDLRLEDLFSGALLSHGRMGSLNFFSADLRPFGMAKNEQGLPEYSAITGLTERAMRDPDILRVMAICRESDGPVWQQPEYFQDESFLVLTHPVFFQDKFLGCLGATVEVRSLSELMVHLGDRFDATLFIIRGRDRVLAHASLQYGHEGQSKETPLLHLNDIDDSVLQRIWDSESVHDEFAELAEEGIQLRLAKGEHEKPWLFLMRSLEGYGDEPLLVGAWFPWESFSAQIMRLFYAMISGLVLLVIGIGLAVFMGRRIARPIKETALAATRVSHFSLDDVEALPPSRFRELNDQVQAFNSMLTGLRAFGKYVPDKLVERLIRQNQGLNCLSQERELTVIFTDIAGFTQVSEHLPATDVADFLNHHFELLGTEVLAEQGTIDKYIGDALMAFWGAPEVLDDAPVKACRAALAIRSAIEADNRIRRERGLNPVHMRIGIHTGAVVVGNIGSTDRINYTIVGDTVNAAQRLEASGKQFSLPDEEVVILISGETCQQLTEEFLTQDLGAVQVKGRHQPIDVFRLQGIKDKQV
ncbi:adenylate/guanylate cyclase domain-containing protein [Oceanospirillum sediminis]|uniref:Adenylate/guanylate cyclase domain-containing protein n=1 Tax=Oceanospirillum sediminis TaxID=2760088 RepID=A0A839IRC3_9GAMM|nr:adenylate/guanylate cyclase domain-containing protein [Oceanospirillum sediminis]MBB1487855.1 adenylate/guanylate cyclase domain-containing protein [Oceanospirillum sediminis]